MILQAVLLGVGIFGFGAVYSWIWVPMALAALGGACYLAAQLLRQGRTLPWFTLLWPGLGLGLLIACQWRLGWSLAPGQTLTGLLQLVLYGAVYYLALYVLQSRTRIRATGLYLWFLTGILAGEAIWQYFTTNGLIYGIKNASYGTPIGPYIYHNHFAGAMDVLLPISVAVAFRPPPRGAPAWVSWTRRGLVPALGLAAVVVSQSRGGVLVVLGEALLALLLFWRPKRQTAATSLQWAAVALLLVGFAFLANFQPLWRRFAALAQHDPSAQTRVQVARSAWAIFRDHPWTGTGLGTFAVVYPAYARFDNDLTIDHAHDEYLEGLAELGGAGMALVVIFGGMTVLSAYRYRDAFPRYERSLRAAALVGSVGFLAHCVGDFEFHAPGNAVLFLFCCALAAAPGLAAKREARREEEAEVGKRQLNVVSG